MYRPRNFRNVLLMSALGDAFAAGGGLIGAAIERVEQAAVLGAIKCTHAITEQVCEFDTLDQLQNFLAEVADHHNWKLPDYLTVNAPAAAPVPQPLDTTGQTLADVQAALETKTYSDGTSATGTAPLPEMSPAQQDAKTAATDTPAPAAELNPPASTEPTPQWVTDAQPPAVDAGEPVAADTTLGNVTGPATTTDTAATGDTPAIGA